MKRRRVIEVVCRIGADGCPLCVTKNIDWKIFFCGNLEKYDAVGIFSNLLTKGNCISVPSESGHPSPQAQTASYEG